MPSYILMPFKGIDNLLLTL
ncbi:hypothetical protein VTL71DRAFT_1500 [Oculimacula yallundae]|uniref:Uncharacterized protein n=1 Tax=Oculimacula yallundae TaxID=86028 RepID=A0ABR4CAX3_9HELO